ncbi:hypothetical protein BDY24DRAFT_417160 [Mrakia frigida]|uniref:YciI family protein n=1 Tax=Mrakia frigida TaxID=29902 RepID=UPI003FCBF566
MTSLLKTAASAASTLKQNKYVVWAPDYTDSGALGRRLAVREKHLSDTHESWKKGEMELGGGFLSTDENEGSSPPPLAGSVLIVYYPSIEDVKKRIERDPYWINNVWDKEKMVVRPILLFDGPSFKG